MSIAIKFILVAGSLLGSVALTGCVSQSSYDQLDAENAQLHSYIQSQRYELNQTKSELADSQGQTTRLQGAVKYTVESDLLFKSGSWEISDEGKDVIGKMAHTLAPTQENNLVVTGFTDNEPIGDTLEMKGIDSNQELSQKRADEVRNLLIDQGVKPDLIIARGGGETRPIAPNDSAKGRSQNRRVELSLGG
jgi:chemotaxis protein MotB